jgi:glycosyltransferase involved in cell wall biosynthesis
LAAVIRASVIVPAFDAADTIGRTIEAIRAQDVDEAFEVIVIDDGSRDDTVATVEAADPDVRILRQRQRGPGQARNLGARHARGEVLAFTDADCMPAPAWLREGITALTRADLVQGAVHPDPRVPRMPFDRTLWVTRESGLYECASLFVSRRLFERIGGFDDWLGARLGKQLAEDAWLGWRARRAGARTAFSERALVHHAVFRRRARQYVAERARLVYFPAIVRQMPELRTRFLYRRWFLSRRTASFDVTVAGAIAGVVARSPLPLIAAAPYIVLLLRGSLAWRRHAARVAAADLSADGLGFAALILGSLRSRTPVL